MRESVKGGRVWSPTPEKHANIGKELSTIILIFVASLLFTVGVVVLGNLSSNQANGNYQKTIEAYTKMDEVTKSKLVSQCGFTTTEAEKFFTKKDGLNSIQGVKIEGKATVVKLQLKDSKAVVSDFLTKKTVCSFTIPKMP